MAEAPGSIALVAAQANLESAQANLQAVQAVAVLFLPEHGQAYILTQAAVEAAQATLASARANLAAVEQARAAERTHELAFPTTCACP